MKRERRRPHGGKNALYILHFLRSVVKAHQSQLVLLVLELLYKDAKTAANALVANKVILGSGDAELAAFTTAREVTTQTTELQ